MISETITIPKTISEGEDRFVVKLKDNLLRMIKEINRNGKKIDEINTEHKDPDYTDIFNSKANVDASNVGYGSDFLEKKNDEDEVVYDAEQNRIDWGTSLTNKDNTIAGDNLTLVSSQNVYDETHPYMAKDENDNWINPYHYINYKNLINHDGAEDINKQDRWSERDFFQPHEPNDNKVKENLIALDTAIYEVAEQLDGKANISLDNLNQTGLLVINAIGMGSTYVRDLSELGEADPLVKVRLDRVQDQQTGLYTNVYTVYSDYDPSGGQQDLSHLARMDGTNVGMNRVNAPYSDTYVQQTQYRNNWASALGLIDGTEEVEIDGHISNNGTATNNYSLIDSKTYANGVFIDNTDTGLFTANVNDYNVVSAISDNLIYGGTALPYFSYANNASQAIQLLAGRVYQLDRMLYLGETGGYDMSESYAPYVPNTNSYRDILSRLTDLESQVQALISNNSNSNP